MQFRDKLFELRKGAGMTQNEMADLLNVSRQTVSKWEMGVIPDVNHILAISKLFDVSVDYLIDDDCVEKGDVQIMKKTVNYKRIWIRIAIALCIVLVALIIGKITHAYMSVMVYLGFIGFAAFIYYVIKLIILLFSSNKK